MRKLKKMDIYVVRVSSSSNICKSDPCKDCLKFIKNMGIRNIIFSLNDNEILKVKVNEWETEHVSKGRKRIDEYQS